MRDLAKSFFGASLAMSLFGLEQVKNLIDKDRSGNREERLRKDLDSLAGSTESNLTEKTLSLYKSGDRFQREVVDFVFDIFRTENWKPRRFVDLAADLAEKSAETLRDAGSKAEKEEKAAG